VVISRKGTVPIHALKSLDVVDTWAFLRRRIKPMITKAEHPAMATTYANPANISLSAASFKMEWDCHLHHWTRRVSNHIYEWVSRAPLIGGSLRFDYFRKPLYQKPDALPIKLPIPWSVTDINFWNWNRRLRQTWDGEGDTHPSNCWYYNLHTEESKL